MEKSNKRGAYISRIAEPQTEEEEEWVLIVLRCCQ